MWDQCVTMWGESAVCVGGGGCLGEEPLLKHRGTTTQHLIYLDVSAGNAIQETRGQTLALRLSARREDAALRNPCSRLNLVKQ